MKKLLVIFTALLLANVAVAKGNLPKGAIKNGSLSNKALIKDAMPLAVAQANAAGCNGVKEVELFTAQMPKGKKGGRVWKELWRVDCKNGKYPVKMTFQETGKGISVSAE